MSVYVCSDIHGHYDLFLAMLKDIRFSDDDKLYIIGDIIDRGPQSIHTLLDIMKRDNVFCAMGNHELMMLDYLTSNTDNGRAWTYEGNGGSKTLKQYKELPNVTQKKILNYIKDMYLQFAIEENGRKFLLSHSSFIGVFKTLKVNNHPYVDVFNTVWNSPWRFFEFEPEETYRESGFTHVIGHVPVQAIDFAPLNQAYVDEDNHIINIDRGCAYIGTQFEEGDESLCCMNLTEYAKENKNAFSYYRTTVFRPKSLEF